MQRDGEKFVLESPDIHILPDWPVEFPASEAQERAEDLIGRFRGLQEQVTACEEQTFLTGNRARLPGLKRQASIIKSMVSMLLVHVADTNLHAYAEGGLERFSEFLSDSE